MCLVHLKKSEEAVWLAQSEKESGEGREGRGWRSLLGPEGLQIVFYVMGVQLSVLEMLRANHQEMSPSRSLGHISHVTLERDPSSLGLRSFCNLRNGGNDNIYIRELSVTHPTIRC